jgi:acyl-CoA dehydrogenase
MGLDLSFGVVMAEALGTAHCGGVPLAIGVQTDMCTPALAKFGSDELKRNFLAPAIAGQQVGCIGVSESGGGSDVAAVKTVARKDGDDYVINGVKHFISHAEEAAFTVLFAATGEEDTSHGKKKLITAFLVDKGTPGFTVRNGYRNVSHRGYTNAILEFNDCRIHKSQILGEEHRGFEVANEWLGATRLQVAATCLGRAERALEHGPLTASSSGSRSASSRACRSSSPTWRWN